MTKDDLNLENPQLIVGHKKQIINPKPIVKDTKKSVIEVSNPQKQKIYFEGVVTDNNSEEGINFNRYNGDITVE